MKTEAEIRADWEMRGQPVKSEKEWREYCLKQFYAGVREGLTRFAWWKNGQQFVGSCGTTLQTALKELDTEEKKALAEMNQP
ncbi:MAG: hypothetical protein M0R80_25760 [Proteobacteria bacterium]|jgi:hypothetical protein|nr:hypothetical protein [Pseudomonadota bacterium]